MNRKARTDRRSPDVNGCQAQVQAAETPYGKRMCQRAAGGVFPARIAVVLRYLRIVE